MCSSNALKDRIYPELNIDFIRDVILNRTLERNDCNNNDVYKFLKLLKQPGRCDRNSNSMVETIAGE